MDIVSVSRPLPHSLPAGGTARLALFVVRRIGAHGLHDARATQIMMQAFGTGFRRPLSLMRAMMADLAASAATCLTIAPCCCARATDAERALLLLLECAETRPARARLLLADLLGNRSVDGALASIAAVSAAFADLGHPIVLSD
ncbi:conserved hypothetical protein [Sphingomonas sp. EC-HK361]|uniref:DUF6628 family protein n=1 Tax=Sphingomonas sp. EC-HK361 TaxID=2038397 RepID=UPI001258C34B|nr:DUF6628 family protein [Sphingomonas sp. EC-HK361]VVT10679.1 conserved hypothetical protein [Sphingomonas sp. EC-HK361]